MKINILFNDKLFDLCEDKILEDSRRLRYLRPVGFSRLHRVTDHGRNELYRAGHLGQQLPNRIVVLIERKTVGQLEDPSLTGS